MDLRWTFVPVLVLYGVHQAVRAWALVHCVPTPGSLRYRDAVAVRLSGEAVQFLTFTGPVLAEPTKAWLLKRRGLTVWEGLATTLAEYLASSLTAAVLAVAGLGYVLTVLRPAGAVRVAALAIFVAMLAFVVVFVVAIALRLYVIGAIVRSVARLPIARGHLRHRIEGLPAAEALLIDILGSDMKRLVRIVSIECLGQLCLGVELLVLLVVLEPTVGLGHAMLVEGATKFITAGYFFVPGQVGVAEGSYAVIFSAFGLAAQAGVAVSFVRRLRSIATAGLGLAALSRLTGGEPFPISRT